MSGGDGGGIAGSRDRIGAIDRELVTLLAERVRLARHIGRSKRDTGAATLDPAQEAVVVRRAVERARELGMSQEPVRQLFWIVVGMSRDAQLEEES